MAHRHGKEYSGGLIHSEEKHGVLGETFADTIGGGSNYGPDRSLPASAQSPQVSAAKAKEILRHGEVHGEPLTPKQKRFFGARAGGAPVRGG